MKDLSFLDNPKMRIIIIVEINDIKMERMDPSGKILYIENETIHDIIPTKRQGKIDVLR